MTTYNTGNGIGSADPRDLYDNAQNLDDAVNGSAATWQDRLGSTRKSWAAFESGLMEGFPLATVVSSYDDITISGVYAAMDAIGTPISGRQVAVWHAESSRAYQFAMSQRTTSTNRALMWFRYRSSTGWDDWQEIATLADVDAAVGNYGHSSALITDLNSITDNGVYLVGSETPNIPVANSSVIVQHMSNFGDRAQQLAFVQNTGTAQSRMFTRYRYSDGVTWEEWREIPISRALNHSAARASMVARLDGSIIYAEQPDTTIAPASLTKVITAITAVRILADMGMDAASYSITVSSADEVGGSGANVFDGDTLTLHDALTNMMLASSNNTASALARNVGESLVQFEGGGDDGLARFIAEINRVAFELGMWRSSFVNPTGLSSSQQFTTVSDMTKMMLEAATTPEITSVWGEASADITVGGPNARTESIEHSIPIMSDDDILGGKSGTLYPSVFNAAVLIKLSDGTDAVATILGSNGTSQRYDDLRTVTEAAIAAAGGAGFGRALSQYGHYPPELSNYLAPDWDAITVSGTYRNGNYPAVGAPIAQGNLILSHVEGLSPRAHQTCYDTYGGRQWRRVRGGDGVFTEWYSVLDSGSAKRVVDVAKNEGYFSASVARIRPALSSFFEVPAFDDIYTTAAEINGHFRQLVTDFPDYVSEEALGNDSLGNPLWSLTFSPPDIIGNHHYPSELAPKKILLTAGVHPNEREQLVATLCMIDSLCRHWRDDELLTWIRWNVEIVLIPCVNPSGVNAGNTRYNHNDVDINRNFPTRWDAEETAAGSEAASEAETQLVLQWLADHSEASAHIDLHSHQNAGYPLWFVSNEPTLPTVERIARDQHAWMRREILGDEGNVARYAISPLKGGMMATHAAETMGLSSHVLEGPISSAPSWSGVPEATRRLMNAMSIMRSVYEWGKS